MAGKRGDAVRTEFYLPKLFGTFSYANNPAKNRQTMLQRFYLMFLTEMACNRFKWDGLPKEIDKRFLELGLLNRGLMVMFKDEEKTGEYMVMRASGLGPLNIYDSPTYFEVQGGTGVTYIQRRLKPEECVPIWTNYLRVSEFSRLQLWADRLSQMDRTIEISIDNARQTKLVGVPEEMRLSAENVIKQMREGEPTVFGSEDLTQLAHNIETLDLESHPSKLMNLLISKGKIWNEIMTYMGVNNSNQDKKERLVADEVAANDEQIDLVKQMHISTRQKACEDMKEKWELNVSVEFLQAETANIDGANQGVSANAVPKMDAGARGWGSN